MAPSTCFVVDKLDYREQPRKAVAAAAVAVIDMDTDSVAAVAEQQKGHSVDSKADSGSRKTEQEEELHHWKQELGTVVIEVDTDFAVVVEKEEGRIDKEVGFDRHMVAKQMLGQE